MMKNTILLWMCLVGAFVFAQDPSAKVITKKCGTMENLEKRMKADPGLAEKMAKIQEFTAQKLLQARKAVDDDIITIPVVVHVVYSNSNENISAAQIQSQIDVLNEDFRRTNSDRDNVWPQADDSGIEFCLASIDPNGNATTGITRTSSTRTSWGTNDAIKSASQGGVTAWDTSQYLNMWIGNIGGGILGYAQFPGGLASTDGLVMGPQYFGSSAKGSGFYLSAPFDLGRTTTHEVGHFLNLRHIWGDGGCGVDDFVEDTPLAGASNGGCTIGTTSCGSVDMVQNYMDYTDDDCMNLFTAGQVARMRSTLLSGGSRRALALSLKCGGGVIPPPPPSGCASTISNFPYAQSFEADLGVWSNESSTDDIDWIRDATGTPSVGTGPSSGSDGSFYMFVEASGNGSGYPNKNAILNSPCFDLSGLSTANFNFQYHMDGTNIGELSVEVRTANEGDWISLFSRSGAQGASWNQETISLASYVGETSVQLRFNTTTGSSWQGDVAIDEVSITSGTIVNPPTGCTDIMLSFTFDNYPEETSFAITNASGTTISSGGPYTDQADGVTLNLEGCFDAGCYELTVNDDYGDGICCNYGNGSYSLSTSDGTILVSGARFGASETTSFCLGSGRVSPAIIRTVADEDAYVPMTIAPNPTNSGVITIVGAALGNWYSVVNIYGQEVLKGALNGKSIDVEALSSGVYIIQLYDGKSSFETARFVVE